MSLNSLSSVPKRLEKKKESTDILRDIRKHTICVFSSQAEAARWLSDNSTEMHGKDTVITWYRCEKNFSLQP